MSNPTVSVGLPVYNGEKYLEAALNAVIRQDFQDFEFIISDNASQDRTEEICRAYAGSDKRIKYSRLEINRGAAPNYQRVFELATGKYFKWTAHDDGCLPGFLGRCVEVMEQAPPDVVLVYPRAQIIDADGNVTGISDESIQSRDRRSYWRATRVVQNVNLAWPLFGLIRSDVLRKTRLIDSFIGSDYVLLAELAMLGEIWEIPDVLLQRRVYAGMSNVVHKSRTQWLKWMDSSRSNGKSPLPDWMQIGWQCARSPWHLPLSSTEKVVCSLMVPSAWCFRKVHDMGGRYKRKILPAVGG